MLNFSPPLLTKYDFWWTLYKNILVGAQKKELYLHKNQKKSPKYDDLFTYFKYGTATSR